MNNSARGEDVVSGLSLLKVLITGPAVSDLGGVSAFFASVSPHLSTANQIEYLEIGSTRGRFLHPLTDQIAFRRLIKSTQFDLIQINPSMLKKSFFRDGLLALQAKSRGIPLLVFFHGWSYEFAQIVEQRWMRFFNSTFGRADGFIVLDPGVEEILVRWGIKSPIFRETTAINEELVSGFDLEKKLLAPRQAGTSFRLLFLARLEPDKGLYETVDACTLLLDKGHPISLTIAGDGSEAQKIQGYAKEKLGQNVSFPGYVRGAEKAALFKEAHAFVMPSYREGLPISVLEAMAFGLPIVTRPVGGLKELLVDGKHGFISESKDPEVIAAVIEKLINQPQLANDISRNVHDLAMRKLTASAVAERFSRIYREISETGRKVDN